MLENSEIISYIHRNSYGAQLLRGKTLFKKGAVKEFKIDKNYLCAHVKVQENLIYDVEINDFTNDFIKLECDCRHYQAGLCEHKIAALLYTDNYLKNNPNMLKDLKSRPVKSERNSGKAFKIDNINEITAEYLYHNMEKHLFFRAQRSDDFDVNIKKIIGGKEITAEVGMNWYSEEVKFEMKENELFTTCSCNETVTGFCEHQAIVLLKILNSFDRDFFKYLSPEYIKECEAEALKEYGLPENADFKDYFEFKFEDNRLQTEPSGKGAGLIKLEKFREDKENFMSKLFLDDSIGIVSKINFDKESKLEIAYAFSFENESKINNIFEIIPIYGKPNKAKTKLSTHIRKISEKEYSHQLDISEEDEDLIYKCKKISRGELIDYVDRNEVEYSTSHEKLIFLLKYYINNLKDVIPYLIKRKYIYSTFGNITRNDLIPIEISDIKPEIKFRLREDENFYNLETILSIDNNEISDSEEISQPHFLIINYNKTFYFLNSVKEALILYSYFFSGSVKKTSKQGFDDFFENQVKFIAENYPVEIELTNYKTKTIKLEAKKRKLYISELGKFVIFKPFVEYDNQSSANILLHGNIIQKKGDTITTAYRDLSYEKEYYEIFNNLHPKFKNQFREDFFHLNLEDLIEDYWFFDAFEKLKEHNIEIFGLKDLKNFKYSPHKAKVSINIASGQDWFDVNINVKFGDSEISLKDVRKAVLKNERFIKLDDGSIGILPQKWLDKFEKYFRHGQIKNNDLKISKLKFSIIDELFDKKDYTEILKELSEKKAKLKKFTKIKNVKIPQKLEGTLRDYQKSGYNWLNFLHEFKWGGILADDMGLGKTIQILAFLLKQKQKTKKANLIVLPSTLLFNWENEIEKFASSLTAYFHYGTNRENDYKIFKNYDLIITTYGIINRDIGMLQKYKFNYIILDESQAIKNPNSQRFKAITLLNANNRLALTGTPIENNTFDLYAQMEFLNPGFLGSPKQFKDNYSTPIDKERDPLRAAELQSIINPFVLRRTKEQVATELPPKTEDFVFCEMEKSQRKVYDAFRNKYRNFLLNKIEEDGIGKSKIYILEGLMKLRQICDSPEILSDQEDYGKDSVKIRELLRHINEKTGKHKILVFSQFVKMLKLIQKELLKENIKHEYLDGQSTQKARRQSVENFQNDKSCRVFLISLKAGGTGINLTEADYVYIVDPWWNPAVENQAIDRCYRIGQDKKVIAYRMICKDTIEEKIMEHQAKKRQIASDIISNDESFVKQLGKDDISKLFE